MILSGSVNRMMQILLDSICRRILGHGVTRQTRPPCNLAQWQLLTLRDTPDHHLAQFSLEIMRLPDSVLSGKQQTM